MSLRRLPTALGLLFGLLLASAPARAAAPARALEPPRLTRFPTTAVDAGADVELRWSAPGAGIEEVEVLLSVDGGRTFPIRVTPSLESATGRWTWRVPNLPSAGASLRVRALIDGRETPGPATPLFRIVGAAGAPAATGLVHEDGWWGGVEGARRDAAPDLAPRAPVLIVAADATPALPPAPGGAPAPPAATPVARVAPAPAARGASTPLAHLAPRTVPLRN